MKKIISFNISKLYVKELGTLARNVSGSARGLVRGNLIPLKMVDDLDAAIVVYDGAVGKITASEATQLSARLDDDRDDVVLALKGLVMSAKYRSNEPIRLAGRLLEEAIRHRGWQMQAESYAAETNAINQLLGDIKATAELKSAVTSLHADELIEQLVASNQLFVDNEHSRVAAGVAKGDVSSLEAVIQLRKSILTVFNYLNSVSGVYPQVETTIDTINGGIEPFAKLLKTRVTLAENAKKEENEKLAQN